MEIRQLRQFIAVIEHETVTRAAQSLYISQPSLSQAIRAFERELGVELFARSAAGLTLTSAGKALEGPARRTLRELETARQVAHASRGTNRGHIDIATLPTLGPGPLYSYIGAFRRKYPDVTFGVVDAEGKADLLDNLRASRGEVGVTELPHGSKDFSSVRVALQRIVLLLPPGMSWPGNVVRLEEIGSLPLVMAREGSSLRRLVEENLQAAGVEPNVVTTVTQNGSLGELVLFGAGATFLPLRAAVSAHIRGATAKTISPKMERRIGIIYRNTMNRPLVTEFIEASAKFAERIESHMRRAAADGLDEVEAALAIGKRFHDRFAHPGIEGTVRDDGDRG